MKKVSQLTKRSIPVLITFIIGFFTILVYFIGLPSSVTQASNTLNRWATTIVALAIGFGTIVLVRTHAMRVIKRREGEWVYSIVIIVGVIIFPLMYITIGPNSSLYKTFYQTVNATIGASIYGLVLFTLVGAMYRTFRARRLNGLLLLIASCIVMLQIAPIGEAIWSGFPVIGQWIIDYPMVGAYRGIMIASAFGALAICFRTLLGYEGGHVSGGEG